MSSEIKNQKEKGKHENTYHKVQNLNFKTPEQSEKPNHKTESQKFESMTIQTKDQIEKDFFKKNNNKLFLLFVFLGILFFYSILI